MSNQFKACHKCTEREIGCHSWCGRYAKEVAKNEARKARQNLCSEADSYASESQAIKMDKAAKANKKNARRTRPANYRKAK